MRKTVSLAHIVERANTYFQVSKPDQREARRMLQSFVESILYQAKAYHGFRYLTADDMPESFPPGIIYGKEGENHLYPDDSRIRFYCR
jgi:hypothetical protein